MKNCQQWDKGGNEKRGYIRGPKHAYLLSGMKKKKRCDDKKVWLLFLILGSLTVYFMVCLGLFDQTSILILYLYLNNKIKKHLFWFVLQSLPPPLYPGLCQWFSELLSMLTWPRKQYWMYQTNSFLMLQTETLYRKMPY